MVSMQIDKWIQFIGAPILVLDFHDYKIQNINESAETITGFSNYQLKEASLSELFSEKSLKSVEASLQILKGIRGHESIKELDLEIHRKTGRTLPVNVITSVFQHDQEKLFLLTLEDLSALKKMAVEREKITHEAYNISKLADIGRLAAGLAHELNNPLAVIHGHTEALQELMHDQLNIKSKLIDSEIDAILSTSKRMARIIRKIMNMVRDEPPQKEKVLVHFLVSDAIALLDSRFKKNGVEVSLSIDPGLEIFCDVTRLQQVIINVVNNAFDAIKEIPNPKIVIRSITEGPYITIAVWNNGPPISDENRNKILTPFFTTKKSGEGIGLGLFLSHKILQTHQGELNFKNLKQGIEFLIRVKNQQD